MKRSALAALLALFVALPLVARAEDDSNLEALKKAAAAGNVAAQYEVGVLYEFGYRMPNNLVPALAWYMLAADNGDERAARRRDAVQAQLKPAEIEEARKLRAELLASPAKSDAPPTSEPAPAAGAAPPAAADAPPPEPTKP